MDTYMRMNPGTHAHGCTGAQTLADGWGKKAAMAYRQPLLRASRQNVVTFDGLLSAVKAAACAAVPKGGPLLYSLPGMHTFCGTGEDAIEHAVAGRGCCGPPIVGQQQLTIQIDAMMNVTGPLMNDRCEL